MTMNDSLVTQPSKRKLMGLATLWPWLVGCAGPASADGAIGAEDAHQRFKRIGVVLVVDAVPGAELRQVVFYDERFVQFYASSLVAKRNREILALGGSRVPLAARIVWGEGRHYDYSHATWYGGTILGDYTIPVAERIPDEVLNDIRARGGSLRLKFRLKTDGVLFGWDIERDGTGTGYTFKYDMIGGDFKEARIFNGKPVEPGWYIDKNGQKIQTDF